MSPRFTSLHFTSLHCSFRRFLPHFAPFITAFLTLLEKNVTSCYRHQYLFGIVFVSRGEVYSLDVMENGRSFSPKRRQGSVPYPFGNISLRGLLGSGAPWRTARRQEISSCLFFPLSVSLTSHFNSVIVSEVTGFMTTSRPSVSPFHFGTEVRDLLAWG